MKVTVPMILITVVCASALVFTGLAYSAEMIVDDNRVSTATVYCTLGTTSSVSVGYSVVNGTSSMVMFNGQPGCEVTYSEQNGNGSAILVMDVHGKDGKLSGSTINILNENGDTIGSSTFSLRDGEYHAEIRGFLITNNSSFSFGASISFVNQITTDGALIFEITAYPISGGQ